MSAVTDPGITTDSQRPSISFAIGQRKLVQHNTRYQVIVIASLALLLGVSLVDPIYPHEQFLQHGPTAVAIVALLWAARRGWLSNQAMTCIVAFLVLHVIGARYIYSYVPWGDRLTWLAFGGELSARNHYDRLVHLAFGVLAMVPTAEVARRYGALSVGWAGAFAVGFVLAVSAAYEVFEWLLTILADPRYADNYNGQQGDAWDAQKDMALAGIGALVALPLVRKGEPGKVEKHTASE